MFKVVYVDGIYRAHIDNKNSVNKYGEPRLWATYEEAEKWILAHSYKGMSFKYEIMEVKNEIYYNDI